MERQHQTQTGQQGAEKKHQTYVTHGDVVLQMKRQQRPIPPASTPPPPPSSTSPSHEFSFTISLHSPPLAAIDLSPADEIFFHGHLLPLHLLSHLPVSPRSSTNSMDSFTLPIKELSESNKQAAPNGSNTNVDSISPEKRCTGKSKSFSLFGLPKRKTECEKGEKKFEERQEGKSKLVMSRFLGRYMKSIKPFIISLRNRRENLHTHRQQHSISENLNKLRGIRDFSAPASMGNSPTNSGILMATGNMTPTNNNKSDSTMEELQAAIQAAIGHCKKSAEGKNKLP